MSTVFFWLFGAMGALFPYFSVYYRSLGLSGTQISILLSVLPVLLFLSQPVFGPLTDRSGHRGKMLGWLLFGVSIGSLLMAAGSSFAVLLPTVALWAFFAGPLVPIGDSIALGEVMATGVRYPRLRLWGSVGFLGVSTLTGLLYKVIDLRWAFLAYAVLNLVACYFARKLPAEGVSSQRPLWPELRKLMSNRYLLVFLCLSALIHGTYAAHSAFFSVHLQSIGGTSGTVGLAWGFAALMEVPVWIVLGSIAERTGPLPLLIVSGFAYAVRWLLYSMVTSPGVLVGLQSLQALSFAMFMPTAVGVVGELTPPSLRTSGQALLFLVNGGIATVVGNLGAGWVVDHRGTSALYRALSYITFVAGAGFVLLLLSRSRNKSQTEVAQHG